MRAWNAGFHDLSRIFAPLASLGHGFDASPDWPELEALNALARRKDLRNAAGTPLSFVAAAPKRRRGRKTGGAPELPYEQRVFGLGEVPTRRHSWHDYFNAMAWALWPATKAALNARQVAQAGSDHGKIRTREQDRLAMFDEGGAVVVMPSGSLPEGLATIGPITAPPWLVVLGHAVYESVAVQEKRDIRLFALVLDKGPAFFAQPLAAQLAEVDADAAATVAAGGLALDGPARMTGILLSETGA